MNDMLIFFGCAVCLGVGFWSGYMAGLDTGLHRGFREGMDESRRIWRGVNQ